MKREELIKLNNEILNKVGEILKNKGEEYQKDENVFSNFESNALELGLSKYQIWSVYFTKHVKSIVSAIKKNPENPDSQKLSEPYEGRIIDAIAYLLLLNAMIKSEKVKKD